MDFVAQFRETREDMLTKKETKSGESTVKGQRYLAKRGPDEKSKKNRV